MMIRFNPTRYSNVLEETIGYTIREEWDEDAGVPMFYLIDLMICDMQGPYYDIKDIIEETQADVKCALMI